MEVLRNNFTSSLPFIEDCLQKCDFVAVDTEFTGLAVSTVEEASLFDSMQERYTKVRKVAQNFIVCQIGLSAFIKDSATNKYVAHSFNFYVLPRHQDNRYNFQASNVNFLCTYKFDFNKLFYDGIPYVDSALNVSTKTTEKGFSSVFNMLVELKKPLLGHNMFYDLLFMYEKFYEPLPVHYMDFKQKLHSLFPLIVDTKNVCLGLRKHLGSTLLEFSSLSELYTALIRNEGTLLHSPVVCHAPGCKKYSSGTYFHEAAYDAFCVGTVFLRLAHLTAMKGLSSMEAYPVACHVYFQKLKPYTNKINVSRGPLSFLNLSGEDPVHTAPSVLIAKVQRGHTITKRMLEDNLGDLGNADVQVLNNGSALIALASVKRAESILLNIKPNLIHVRKYSWVRDTLPNSKMLWLGILMSAVGVTGLVVANALRKNQ